MTALAITAMVAALDSALLHFVWQGVAVAVALWVALAMLRRCSADARYLVSGAAMAILAAMPIVTAWRAYERPRPVDGAAVTIVQLVTTADIAPEGIDWLAAVQNWMAPVWASGVLLLSLRMLWGCAKVSQLKREGDAAEPALLEMVERVARRVQVSRPVRVLMSRLADGPSVVGWLKPVLLLPAATVLGLSAEQLEAVLAHELAHVRRYDYLVNLAQMLMETLFFYHPAVWWISRRMREERELCCDDIAVRSCGDAVCYARALTALEKTRAMSPSLALGVKDGPLMYRIERLLGVARREPVPSRLPGMVAICLGLLCFAPNAKTARTEVALPPAPLPEVPSVQATPLAIRPGDAKPRLRMLAQATQNQATIPPRASDQSVVIEVSIDSNGDVSDARVVSGNQENRKQALITSLNMHFPQDDGQSTRLVTIPFADARPGVPRGAVVLSNPQRIVFPGVSAQERINEANAQIARLKALQVDASDRGRAQLQELIDSYSKGLIEAERTISGPDPLIGAELIEIRVDGGGIFDAQRIELRSKLPIHLHDSLSDESMKAAVAAVRAMYPNATAYFGRVVDYAAASFSDPAAYGSKAAFLVTLPRGAFPVR